MLDRRFAPMASLLAVSVLVAGAASNVQPALAEGAESPVPARQCHLHREAANGSAASAAQTDSSSSA